MLTRKQAQVLELMLTTDMQQKEIGAKVGVSEVSICKWKKMPEFQAAFRQRVEASLSRAASRAAQVMTELMMTGQSEQTRYLAAKDIMDRAGYKPAKDIRMDIAEDAKSKLDSLMEQMR